MNASKVIITDLTTSEVITLPVSPEQVKVSYKGNFASYDVLDIGEVKFPSGVQLSGISFESFFPNQYDCALGYVHVEYFKPSSVFHEKLERIKIDGRKARVMITKTPINFDCYIQAFDCTFENFTGRIFYSIDFIQAKDVEVVTVEEEPPAEESTEEDQMVSLDDFEMATTDLEAEGRDDNSAESATNNSYEVKSGDCLYFIAEQAYGDGNRWPEIYEANREVVGSNPDLIYPGQNLVIP